VTALFTKTHIITPNQKVGGYWGKQFTVDAALECYSKGRKVSLIIRGQEVGHVLILGKTRYLKQKLRRVV